MRPEFPHRKVGKDDKRHCSNLEHAFRRRLLSWTPSFDIENGSSGQMSVPDKNITGKRIQEARVGKNLTQDQLSAKLARQDVQIDRAGISKIENGSRCVYDYELKAIAKVMEASPDWLMGGRGDRSD